MGANVLSRPRTQHDPVRTFSQARGSPVDPVRRRQTLGAILEFPDTVGMTR